MLVDVKSELSRAHYLLGPERIQGSLQESTPLEPPERIGALGGTGYQAHQPDVNISIYVFHSAHQHAAAVTTLTALIDTTQFLILSGTNGRLLFFGYTDCRGADAIEAKYRLSELIGAFSGDE